MTNWVVDANKYVDAAEKMADGNAKLREAVQALCGSLGSTGGMAGRDQGGKRFANAYDQVAAYGVSASAKIVNVSKNYAELLNGTAEVYAKADADSTAEGGDAGLRPFTAPSDFAAPGNPPTAHGNGVTDWILSVTPLAGTLGLIDILVEAVTSHGVSLPSGHQDKLTAAADAWSKLQSQGTVPMGDDCQAANDCLSAQQSPEADDIRGKLTATSGGVKNEALSVGNYSSEYLSADCRALASLLDKSRSKILEHVRGFLQEVVDSFDPTTGGLKGILKKIAKKAGGPAEMMYIAYKWANKIVDVIHQYYRDADEIGTHLMQALPALQAIDGRMGAVASPESTQVSDPSQLPVLVIKMKPGWSEQQKAEMREKVRKFNEQVAKNGGSFTQVQDPDRDPKNARDYRNTHETDQDGKGKEYTDADGTVRKRDVDHIQDLQAGGKDDPSNMQYLDASVNRSFGAQLRNRMAEQPPGTKFGGVRLEE